MRFTMVKSEFPIFTPITIGAQIHRWNLSAQSPRDAKLFFQIKIHLLEPNFNIIWCPKVDFTKYWHPLGLNLQTGGSYLWYFSNNIITTRKIIYLSIIALKIYLMHFKF